jgi:hypothetical protein
VPSSGTAVEAAAVVSLSSNVSATQLAGGGGADSQRPVVVEHTWPCPQLDAVQPATHRPLANSHTVDGGLQAASDVHGGGGTASQRPVFALHAVDPEHWTPPTWLHPGTHWPPSHTVFGALHCASFAHGPATATQRPAPRSQTVPPAHVTAPGWPQPGSQRPPTQTPAGAPHCASLAHGGGVAQRPVPGSQTRPAAQPARAQPATQTPASQTSWSRSGRW